MVQTFRNGGLDGRREGHRVAARFERGAQELFGEKRIALRARDDFGHRILRNARRFVRGFPDQLGHQAPVERSQQDTPGSHAAPDLGNRRR